MRRQTTVSYFQLFHLSACIPLSSNQLKELEFTTKSKQIRYLLVNASTRRDPENNIVGVLGVAQDVTESSKNEKRVAAIAHELVSTFHVLSVISFKT